MPKPLRSADPTPRNVQFSHFGVLDDGPRSKSAAFISIGVNVSIVLCLIILGLVAVKNPTVVKKLDEIYLPPPAQKPPPPPPPKNPPVMPPTPKVLPTPPKITPPPVEKLPEIVKLTPAPPKPLPPAPEVKVLAPPAPKIVSLARPEMASIPNHDAKSSAVRLGNTTSPIVASGPAVSAVNLNAGVPGMPGGNTGNGKAGATKISLGSGAPGGTNMNPQGGSSAGVVKPTNFGTGNVPPSGPPKVTALNNVVASPPKVLYKPAPSYTTEAKSMHLEGNVTLKIRVLATGSVEVLSVVHGLGHGLDESARQATLGTRFKPAVDQAGKPIDWEGTVIVNFQLS